MRKILLIGLAAVILVPGIALVAYAQREGGEGRPPRPDMRGGRPGGEGERRGPPRSQLTEDQRAALAKLLEERVGKDLMEALAKFQAAVKKIVGDDERAVRMAVFGAIMRQMRPEPREGEGFEGRGPGRPEGGGNRGRKPGRGPGDRPPE